MSGGDWKAMFRGIQENDYELVNFYLKSGIDPNYQHPEFMASPLAESLRFNNLQIAELLLKNGADPMLVEMESAKTILAIAKSLDGDKAIELIEKYI